LPKCGVYEVSQGCGVPATERLEDERIQGGVVVGDLEDSIIFGVGERKISVKGATPLEEGQLSKDIPFGFRGFEGSLVDAVLEDSKVFQRIFRGGVLGWGRGGPKFFKET
jgi:hypothetical protein